MQVGMAQEVLRRQDSVPANVTTCVEGDTLVTGQLALRELAAYMAITV